MKVIIPFRPVHISLFLLLAFLCYQAHQLVRHFIGAILCSGFGSMSFTVATTKQPCFRPTIVILAGPLLTYGIAWFGMFLLRSPKYVIFAYFLIFASFAHLRFIQTLTGRGDELILAQQWFKESSRFLVAIVLFLMGLPPLVAAFRTIGNKKRLLVFIGSWALPLILLFVLLVGDKFLFQSSDIGKQFGLVIGIWITVLFTDLIAITLLMVFGPKYFRVDL